MSHNRFSSTLDLLKGFYVNLYVGEEVIKGKLMGVEEDHLVLENNNNYVFYYSLDKIQAITKNTKQFQGEEISAEFLKTTSLTELLSSLTNSWVSILCLNKQTFSGIVSEVDSDFVTLINGEERILIKLTHVSNILKGAIEDNSNNTDSESETNEEVQNETEVTNQDEELENSSNESSDIVEEVKAVEDKRIAKEVTAVEDEHNVEEVTAVKVEHIEEESADISNSITSDNSQSIVWSQSIRPKTVERSETESSSQKTKSSKNDADSSSTKKEKSKKSSKSSSKEQKSSKSKNSKSKSSSKKEVSETKVVEVKQEVKSEKPNKEATALKFSDTANIFGSMVKENKESKNEKKSKDSSEMNIQKDEESRIIRFAGEPITSDSKEAYPFAGWPSRRTRANRF